MKRKEKKKKTNFTKRSFHDILAINFVNVWWSHLQHLRKQKLYTIFMYPLAMIIEASICSCSIFTQLKLYLRSVEILKERKKNARKRNECNDGQVYAMCMASRNQAISEKFDEEIKNEREEERGENGVI